MKLTYQQLCDITQGAAYISEEDCCAVFHRFTTEQEELYHRTNQSFYRKALAPAGVILQFRTDSCFITLKGETSSASTRTYYSIDILEDGVPAGHVDNFSQMMLSEDYTKCNYPLGKFSKTIPLKSGMKTITICMPWSVQVMLEELSLSTEYMAKKVSDTNGCYVVPAFTGLGAPHWDQYARGTIVGLTRGVNKYHLIRATLDSLAYQTNDVLQAMKADSGIDLAALKVDGGASANNYLMQTQSDIIDAPVQRPKCVETTAMGAAYLAGLAVGYWTSKEDVIKNWAIDRTFEPAISAEEREERVSGWNKAVKCSYGWAK